MTARFRVIYTRRALSDLVKVYDFIAADSPDHAMEMVDRILRSIDLLEIIPLRQIIALPGPKPEDTVRSLPVKPYMIFFRAY